MVLDILDVLLFWCVLEVDGKPHFRTDNKRKRKSVEILLKHSLRRGNERVSDATRGVVVAASRSWYGRRSGANSVSTVGEGASQEVAGACRCHHVSWYPRTEAPKRPSSQGGHHDSDGHGQTASTGCEWAADTAERRRPVSEFLRSTTSSPTTVIPSIGVSRPAELFYVHTTNPLWEALSRQGIREMITVLYVVTEINSVRHLSTNRACVTITVIATGCWVI